ncbi:MAG: hypothetical protein AAF481_16175 [Acidobacteriota bacterium]
MNSNAFYLVFFMIYCAEAGIFLLLAPWNAVWDRTVVQLAYPTLQDLFLAPTFRGAVSGFGAIHLVWVAHDLARLFDRRRRMRAMRES